MVLLRLAALLFLVAYGYTTGLAAPARADSYNLVETVIFFVALLALYLLPIYEANRRKHPKLVPIALVDILLGWTIIGWIGAYVWALRIQAPEADAEAEVSPYAVVDEPASRYPANSTADALRELARLHEEGAINDEEYAAAKLRVVAPR